MTEATIVGRVMRSSSIGFAVGCRELKPGVPELGALVKVDLAEEIYIYGLVSDIAVQDDPFVRQMVEVSETEPELVLDQRQRMAPVEVDVAMVGYRRGETVVQGLPPQPPIALITLTTCTDEELRAFSHRRRGNRLEPRVDYFRLLLDQSGLAVDEVLIAHVQRLVEACPPEMQRQIRTAAGKELVRLLGQDLLRLDGILRRI
jgi:hypothetical protein